MTNNPTPFEEFVAIIARLRAPDGCPWDRAQTPLSLRRYLLEEVYEALEAIDLNAPHKLREELGDLLLQIVLQSQIASESGQFTIDDVIAYISAKMIRRHPHVFGDLQGATVREIEENWEKIKRAEKPEGAEVTSFFGDIPKGLPALAEAEDMQQRAWRVGLWDGSAQEVDYRTGQALNQWRSQQDMPSLGDALFMLVDQARRAGLDAESALREANRRFEQKMRVADERRKTDDERPAPRTS
jgi:tetrapyrrole methylase family protein/MazG family protein